jgi:LPPG:FO 2-phospho-L-lactate transferase
VTGEGPVVVLAGGTGGAKLARGFLDVVGAESLVVVANTGDDVEAHGGHVSPDPDLCTWWLADLIDERGWGLEGDSFAVMDGLRELGVDVWFNLGDRDLAVCLERKRRLDAGERLTVVQADLARAFGVQAAVLPMSDQPVQTWVRTEGAWHAFQEFMIRRGGASADPPAVDGVDLRGIEAAAATPEVLDAIARARAVIIGPSNPVISIGPILRVRGIRDALRATGAPVVSVSPLVGGRSVKGPTEAFMAWSGAGPGAAGVASLYGDVLDGMVSDEASAGGLPLAQTDTLMGNAADRARLATETLAFAASLPASS